MSDEIIPSLTKARMYMREANENIRKNRRADANCKAYLAYLYAVRYPGVERKAWRLFKETISNESRVYQDYPWYHWKKKVLTTS